MDVTELPPECEHLTALIRFHETGGHEGEGGDYTLMMARRELHALTTAQSEAAELRKEVERLRGALDQAGQWFAEYAVGHAAKGANDKAERNAERSLHCIRATLGAPA